MFPKDIEVILTRHLASCIALPMFIVDAAGNLVFYNEPAELLIGRRFEETGEMAALEWSTLFTFTDEAGAPIPPESLPLMIALVDRRPAYRTLWALALDGARRHIGVTAFPLIGQTERLLGAAAIFWEVPPC